MAVKELQSQVEYIKRSKEEIHSYSKGVGKLYDLALSYIYDAEKAHKEGKNAAWTMTIWEVPLLYACDTIPVAFTELGRLGSADSITVAEDYFQIPRETCSMVAAILGEWYLRKEAGIKKILGFNASCEPFNVAWELIKNEGYDVYRIDTVYRPPHCDGERYEQLVEFLTEELKASANWLTDGKGLDEERLRFEIKRRNRILIKVQKIMELRYKHPLYIKSLATMYLLMGSGNYFGKPEEYEEVLDLLLEELENKPVNLEENAKVVPLIWAGGRGQEFGVYEAIDDCGGSLLGWMSPNPFVRLYREDIPPFESLARYNLDGQTAGAFEHRINVFEKQIEKSNARGIILYGYVGCSFGGVEQEMEREYFHKRGIPSISLEGSFQVGPPSGQILTRIKAFIEMLE